MSERLRGFDAANYIPDWECAYAYLVAVIEQMGEWDHRLAEAMATVERARAAWVTDDAEDG